MIDDDDAYGPADVTATCFIKIQNGLPFCCHLTEVVLEERPLNGCNPFAYFVGMNI